MLFILLVLTTISWDQIPTDQYIEGTSIEYSLDGGKEYSFLVSAPFPDSSVVFPSPPLGIRVRYRGYFFSNGGPGPRSQVISALYLDFTEGVLPEYTRMVKSWSRRNSGRDLLVVYRPRTPWVSSWREPGDPRGLEVVRYKSDLDFNGDGLHNLSDLSFAGGYGTDIILALFEVYGTPASYEWREE